MLVRSLLGRLTLDATKTSAHDLSQLARLAYRAGFLRSSTYSLPLRPSPNGSQPSSFCSASLRAYATAATTKGSSKSTTKKAPAARKAAPKKKKAAPKKKTTTKKKKPVAKKPATRRRALTEKGKERLEKTKANTKVKELKIQALIAEEPHGKPATAWLVITTENKDKSLSLPEKSKVNADKYHTLSPEEREHYNHLANQNKADNEAAYNAWVQKHTPEEIRKANLARAQLRRLRKTRTGRRVESPRAIRDDRRVKHHQSAYSIFHTERYHSGDLSGVPFTEAAKLISQEYKALSASEKKRYEDLSAKDRQRYATEHEKTYGHPPPSKAH